MISNRNESPAPEPDPSKVSTSQKLADAAHFKTLATSFAAFLDATNQASDEDRRFHRQMLRESYDDVCEALADAHRLTGNREPEMAEAIAELQRIKEDHRELLD